ncbi:hypothetical protein ACFOHY_18555 [Rhizobium rosettiformans]
MPPEGAFHPSDDLAVTHAEKLVFGIRSLRRPHHGLPVHRTASM